MLTVTYRSHVNTLSLVLFTYIQNPENVINLGYSLQVIQIFSPHTSATG